MAMNSNIPSTSRWLAMIHTYILTMHELVDPSLFCCSYCNLCFLCEQILHLLNILLLVQFCSSVCYQPLALVSLVTELYQPILQFYQFAVCPFSPIYIGLRYIFCNFQCLYQPIIKFYIHIHNILHNNNIIHGKIRIEKAH